MVQFIGKTMLYILSYQKYFFPEGSFFLLLVFLLLAQPVPFLGSMANAQGYTIEVALNNLLYINTNVGL